MFRKFFKQVRLLDIIFATLALLMIASGFYFIYTQRQAYRIVYSSTDYSKGHDFEVEDRILLKL